MERPSSIELFAPPKGRAWIWFKFLLSFVRSNYTICPSEYEGTDNGHKFLSNKERKVVAHLLLQHINEERLKKGTRKLIASVYSGTVSVINSIWKRAKLTGDVSHRKTTNCGRKRIELDHDQFRQVPLSKRSNLLIFMLLTFLLLGVNICFISNTWTLFSINCNTLVFIRLFLVNF